MHSLNLKLYLLPQTAPFPTLIIMSGTISKVKVGRLWGYPIIVTTGKSTHEAILLDCNTDDPQEFLNEQIDVKIRWKVAGYNDTVPARDVTLQDIDTQYYVPRKAATMAAESLSKKRKTTSDAPNSKHNSTNTMSNVNINNEDTNEEEDKKPSAVTSSVNIKEEEIETDNDDDNNEPVAVPSSANVKEEDVETDEEGDEKPQAVTSSTNIKEEEVETDNDEDKKPSAVMSGIKTEDIASVETKDIQEEKDNKEDKEAAGIVDLTTTNDDDKKLASASSSDPPTLVEFKFCSNGWLNDNIYLRSSLVYDYEWEGTLHIPMYQDAITGMYTLPVGKTLFRGKLDTKYHKKLDSDDYMEFEGSFVKTEVEPETLRSDYNQRLSREGSDKYYSIEFDLGMNSVEDDNGRKMVYPRENIPGKYTKSTPLNCRGLVLNEWEKNQGGELAAYENGLESYDEDFLKGVGLYTVLSAHKPNEESPLPLRVGPEGYKPDWNFLVNAHHARMQVFNWKVDWIHPQKQDLLYAQTAVKEYRHFLALKAELQEEEDKMDKVYSPSEEIDLVWHTHISFLRRYQCDTLYLTADKK